MYVKFQRLLGRLSGEIQFYLKDFRQRKGALKLQKLHSYTSVYIIDIRRSPGDKQCENCVTIQRFGDCLRHYHQDLVSSPYNGYNSVETRITAREDFTDSKLCSNALFFHFFLLKGTVRTRSTDCVRQLYCFSKLEANYLQRSFTRYAFNFTVKNGS